MAMLRKHTGFIARAAVPTRPVGLPLPGLKRQPCIATQAAVGAATVTVGNNGNGNGKSNGTSYIVNGNDTNGKTQVTTVATTSPGSPYPGQEQVANQPPITINMPTVLLPPSLNYGSITQLGEYKATLSIPRTFVLGLLAGCYIALGGFMALMVGGNLPGLAASNPGLAKLVIGSIFPVGLTMVTLCGGELFTSNTAVITTAVYEKKATMKQLLTNWVVSYAGNLIGSLGCVLAVVATGMLATNDMPASLAVSKTSMPWFTTFVRAVLCNWLVCIAVWQSNAAATVPGKLMALWPPIATFVTVGLEHSIANMFFIPCGMLLGAKVTVSDFIFNNLIPVTLGNAFGGIVLVASAYAFAYGSLGQPKEKAVAA